MSQPEKQWPWPEILGLQKLSLSLCVSFFSIIGFEMGSEYQDRSFQLDAPLVSHQANDPHLSANAPTEQQQQQHLKAIGLLKDEDDRCIFACLDLVRSLEPRLQPCSNYACLTHDQVHAIIALRHYRNDEVSAWLNLARAPSRSYEYYKLIEG